MRDKLNASWEPKTYGNITRGVFLCVCKYRKFISVTGLQSVIALFFKTAWNDDQPLTSVFVVFVASLTESSNCAQLSNRYAAA